MLTCPFCGARLDLTLVQAREEHDLRLLSEEAGGKGPRSSRTTSFMIEGTRYSLSAEDVMNAAKAIGETSRAVIKYYIELPDESGYVRPYPIKEVVFKALSLTGQGSFTKSLLNALRCRSILMKLGFAVRER